MQKLPVHIRTAILRCLVEGNSINSTVRITGAAKNTILDLLERAGEACAAYQAKHLRNLPCKAIQLDEAWSFVGCREKNKARAVNQHPGDVWTWTSICAETKLMPAFRVGDRSSRTGMDFCADLSTRFSGELSNHKRRASGLQDGGRLQFRHGTHTLRATREDLRHG